MGFFFKLLLKAGLTLGVVVLGYKFILPAMTGGGFQVPSLSNNSAKGVEGLGNATVDKDVTVYQWVDDKGVTHIDSTPPVGQSNYTRKTVNANTNVLQATKLRETEATQAKKQPRVAKVKNTYSAEGIKNIMDSAKDLQGQAGQRSADQEQILNDIMSGNSR